MLTTERTDETRRRIEIPSADLRRKLRKWRDRGAGWWYSGDLLRLGEYFRTDKWGSHAYLQHYATHFSPLRKRRINLLEIGIGGYSDPAEGGESLRMWKAYFAHANIYGIDLYDKRGVEEKRIRTFRGDQTDEAFLRRVVEGAGGFDIVIDDGSHVNSQVIRTFEILFPLLRNPGIYAIEDTQTSYWPGFGGSSEKIGDESTNRSTIVGYFASLAHCLNYEEILREGYSPTVFDRNVVAVHMYHNLVFIQKGDNSEGSEMVKDGRATHAVVLGGVTYKETRHIVGAKHG